MIACRNLSRQFGRLFAVRDLSFELPAGSICALLGPNGAGKSTTLGLLTGLLKPTAGIAMVGGIDVSTNPIELRQRIGVVPETLGLFDGLTVEEHFLLSGSIYGLSRAETMDRVEDLLSLFDLTERRGSFAGECSHGMRKKTALAMALLHNPAYLFLDEPFEGLDPLASRAFQDLCRTLAARGVTIFLTSHILAIVERLATRVLMLRQGRLAWDSENQARPESLEETYFHLVEQPKPVELPWLG